MGYNPSEPRDKGGKWSSVGVKAKAVGKAVGKTAVQIGIGTAVGYLGGAVLSHAMANRSSSVGPSHLKVKSGGTIAAKTATVSHTQGHDRATVNAMKDWNKHNLPGWKGVSDGTASGGTKAGRKATLIKQPKPTGNLKANPVPLAMRAKAARKKGT